MKHNLIIDELDAYSEYGVSVINTSGGTYASLLTYPVMKKVNVNDWPEEDGIEPDLDAPSLDVREVNLRFICETNAGGAGFFTKLADGAYHLFNFPKLGRSFRLRLTTESKTVTIKTYRDMTLRFINDTPINENYTYLAPSSTVLLPDLSLSIDGTNIRQYGMSARGNYMSEILRAPDTKPNLTQSFNNKNGAEYDDNFVVYKSKNVKINMLMCASTLDEFWRNYDALIYDLSRPNLRVLTAKGKNYNCYYQNAAITEFHVENPIWLAFSITFVFTNFRP
jgi:hypothetical protein